MERQIKSVKVYKSDAGRSVEVIVSFDDRSQGRIYKTRKGEFVNQKMTADEVAKAEELANRNGEWQNYDANKASKSQAQHFTTRRSTEDAREDIEEYEQFAAKQSSRKSFLFGPMDKEG